MGGFIKYYIFITRLNLKKISLIILIAFLFCGWRQSFQGPGFVYKNHPELPPFPNILNVLAGFFESGFAILLIFTKTRTFAAWGIYFFADRFFTRTHQHDWRCTTAIGQYYCNSLVSVAKADRIAAAADIMGVLVRL